MAIRTFLTAFTLLPLITATPTRAQPAHVINPADFPLITPSPEWNPSEYNELRKRGIVSKIETFASGVGSDIKSLGSKAASVVTADLTKEGSFLSGFPDGKGVQSSLGLADSQVSALPTSVLNLP